VTALAVDDLGTDIALLDDIGLRWRLVSGQANLAMAIVRRLSTPRGSLYYAPSYGFSLLDALNGSFTRAQRSQLQGAIVTEVEKDQRVASCVCDVTFGQDTLTVSLVIQSALGPFDLVLGVDGLTVEILNAGQAGAPAGLAVAETTPSFAGPPGPPGPAGAGTQGPPGPAGVAGVSNQSFSSDQEQGDDSGTELIWWQYAADLSAQPGGTLNADFTLLASSVSGTAPYRLYIGGTFSAVGSPPIGGTLVATATRAALGFAAIQLIGPFTNPTGIVPVVVTIQSSGAGVDARGKSLAGMIIAP
jgi:hypothetical protein